MSDKLARDLEATLESYAASAPAPRDLATAAKQRHRRRQRRRSSFAGAAGAVVLVAGVGVVLTQGLPGQGQTTMASQVREAPKEPGSREAMSAAGGAATPGASLTTSDVSVLASPDGVAEADAKALVDALVTDPARGPELLPAAGATVTSPQLCLRLTAGSQPPTASASAPASTPGYAVSGSVPCLVIPMPDGVETIQASLNAETGATCTPPRIRWVVVTTAGRQTVVAPGCASLTELLTPRAS